jgi:nitronate monooxygenase
LLSTSVTKLFNIQHPIINAPMTPAAGGELAKAVTDAGGLGMIGVESKDTLNNIKEQARIVREGKADRKFGIGLTVWALDKRPELLEIAIQLKPTTISLSFGNIVPYCESIRAAGIKLIVQAQDTHVAKQAESCGADIIVAQGTEAGGHTGTVGTLPLLQAILKTVSCPVLAAGGIGTGEG